MKKGIVVGKCHLDWIVCRCGWILTSRATWKN